eukprot:TRINITY_DN4986_c0_g1_i1.p1 TRINITY_DN4986_c0_g1~~TRINITY_DN4986_c0_g1_i1.p1  ORF type:complete len:385 (-),score=110.49 TRINITY_DN4986_c0_g1_i1:269-1423(-)
MEGPVPRMASSLHTLVIVAHYPSTKLSASSSLFLRGDGLGLSWDRGVRLERSKTSPDQWLTELNVASSDVGILLQFKLLVDDSVWQIGANERAIVPARSVAVDAFPFFYSRSGRVDAIRSVTAPQLADGTRDIFVYTPPSYHENTLKTIQHVLFMHDGQNLFDASTSTSGTAWRCDSVVEKTVNGMLTDEVLIVGVSVHPDRSQELHHRKTDYTHSVDPKEAVGGNADSYLNFLQETVWPLIKSTYRVRSDRDALGMCGSSLGGLVSAYAGWTRPALWSKVACMSSSFWWNNRDFASAVVKNSPAPQATKFYLDYGVLEGPERQTHTMEVREAMLAAVLSADNLFYFLDQSGRHHESSWGARFEMPLLRFYPPSPTPTRPLPSE